MQCSRMCIPRFTKTIVEEKTLGVNFANCNIPEKPFEVYLKEKEDSELPKISQDIF